MKYWAYMDNQVLGPFEKEKLPSLPNFSLSSMICPVAPAGEQTAWKAASTYPEVSAILTSPAPAPVKARRPEESPLALTMRGSLIEMEAQEAAPTPASPGPELPAAGGAAPAQGSPTPVSAPPAAEPAAAPTPISSLKSADTLALTMRGSLISDPIADPSDAPAQDQPAVYTPTPAAASAPEKPVEPVSPPLPAVTRINAGGDAPGIVPEKGLTSPELDAQLEPLRQKLEKMSSMLVLIGDTQVQLLGKLSRIESALIGINALAPSEPKKAD